MLAAENFLHLGSIKGKKYGTYLLKKIKKIKPKIRTKYKSIKSKLIDGLCVWIKHSGYEFAFSHNFQKLFEIVCCDFHEFDVGSVNILFFLNGDVFELQSLVYYGFSHLILIIMNF